MPEDQGSALGKEHMWPGLRDKLERDCGATPEQLDLVARLCGFYSERRLIRGGWANPLHCACPCADECWAGLEDADYPPPDRGEVSVPWVGPGYQRHRVCAVAINANKYGQLGAHWWVIRAEIDALRQGRRRLFSYQTGRYLASALASLDGEPAEEGRLDGDAAAAAWTRCAFVEAIKCSPARGVSAPTDAMRRNCPTRYLSEELRILAPRVVIGVGRPAWTALKDCLDATIAEQGAGFARGTGTLGGAGLDLLLVNHPSHGNWKPALPSLLESLQRDPLVASELSNSTASTERAVPGPARSASPAEWNS